MSRPLLYVCLSTLLVIAVGCGGKKEASASPRISIKHGLDPDASGIDHSAKAISIADLVNMKVPGADNLAAYNDRRVKPFETTTYEIEGTLKSIVHRKDGDYYCVVEDDKGNKAIVEVPDPKLCKGSPVEKDIAAARKTLEDHYHPTDETKEVNDKVTIEGVGFLSTGRPGSGNTTGKPRLMPGTGVEIKGK